MKIGGTVKNAAQVVVRFKVLEKEILPAIKKAMIKLAIRLQKHVKQYKLSGQVLKVRSGTLRRSIAYRTYIRGNTVTAKVGTNVPYGRVHEYGFRGQVNVKAHLRKVNGYSHWVNNHTRKVNLPERSFLRSSLKDLKMYIRMDMKAAVREAKKKAGLL